MEYKRLIILLLFLVLLSAIVSAGKLKSDLQKSIVKKSPNEKIPIVVLFYNKPRLTDIDIIKSDGASVRHQYKIINAVAVNVPVHAVDKIAKRPFVKLVEPDYELKAVLDSSYQQIGVDNLWNAGFTGKDVDVAVVDTGIHKHPDLLISKEVDFTGEGSEDFLGHGTHVAGIIASKNDVYRGIAPDAGLFNVKVIRKEGFAYGSDVIKGIEWSVDNGAEVISMSLGALIENCDGSDAISQAVDKAVDQDVVVVVAAGNSGPDSKTINSPGCAKKALTVGAVDDFDKIADFSSRGPTSDNRVKPDIVAPGVLITSAWIDDSFKVLSGTSMATPHVSGIAALLLDKESSLTPLNVKEKLQSSAVDLGLDQNTQGKGRVNIVKEVSESNFTTPIGSKAVLAINYFSSDNYNVTIGDVFKTSLSIKNSGDLTAESVSSTLNLPSGLTSSYKTKILGDISSSSSVIADWSVSTSQSGNFTVVADVLSANADPVSSSFSIVVNPKPQIIESNKTVSNETSSNETVSQPPSGKTRKLPPGLAKKMTSKDYFGYGVRSLLSNIESLFYYASKKQVVPSYSGDVKVVSEVSISKPKVVQPEKKQASIIIIPKKTEQVIPQQRSQIVSRKELVQERIVEKTIELPEVSQAQTRRVFVEPPRVIPRENVVQETPHEVESSSGSEASINVSTELPVESKVSAEVNVTSDENLNRGRIISSVKSKRK